MSPHADTPPTSPAKKTTVRLLNGKRKRIGDDDDDMGQTISQCVGGGDAGGGGRIRRKAAKKRKTGRFGMLLRSGSAASRSFRHHLDPIALNRQTLDVREHMFGDCDVVVVVKQERFPAHRDILGEHSGFFKAMFAAFVERERDEIELKETVEPALMAQVIHYVYFKNVYLTSRNAQDLLGLSDYLQMPQLQRACSEFMRGLIDAQNCVALYLYTAQLGPRDLRCHAEEFILNNFERAASKSAAEFALLSRDQLAGFLASERLSVSSEASAYRALMQWAGHDPAARRDLLPGLLEHVHFPLMSPKEVEQLARDSRTRKAANLATALDEARRYFVSDRSEKIKYWNERTGAKKPPRWPKILVVMRMYWKNLPMEYFDFRTRQWHKLAEVQYWRSCSALVSYGSCVFLVGGEEKDKESPTGSRTVNRVTKYDCEQKKWSSVQSMNLARRWGASVVLGNTLYIIGGIGGKGGTYERRLDSMEMLDLNPPPKPSSSSDASSSSSSSGRPRWRYGPPMSTARSSHTVEVLDGKIYVVGGGDGKEWFCSSEVYDPAREKWSPIADMNTRRWKCGLCVLGGHLYAIGGMDSKSAGSWGKPLRSVERYFPATNEWSEVSPLATARFGCSCVAYRGRIYVSGGFGHGKEILGSVECYDPATDRWTGAAPMKKMCGFVGGVLVDRPISLDHDDSAAGGTDGTMADGRRRGEQGDDATGASADRAAAEDTSS